MSATTFNTRAETVSMSRRQAELAKAYATDPTDSLVTDAAYSCGATECLGDPLHSHVTVSDHHIPVALHRAIGGDGDGPVPGDILCAALASCMDSSLRVIANRLSIELQKLEVHVSAEVDVRGTLCLHAEVPVGFQSMHVSVDLSVAENTPSRALDTLLNAAEHSCVVLQTLKAPPTVSTQFEINPVGEG